jgi:hypothetical protein
MLAIDLSKVEPLDILLTTSAEPVSKLIKVGQRLARLRLAPVRFSHAAMFMAPSMLVESSDAGVVFEQFTNRTIEDDPLLKHMPRAQAHARFVRLDTRLIVRKNGDTFDVLGGLPAAAHARVIRHKTIEDKGLVAKSSLRAGVLESLEECYLKAYPAWSNFLNTISLPQRLRLAAVTLERSLLGVPMNPGPFCSQLVAQLLQAQGLNTGGRASEATAPVDLDASDQFVEVDCLVDVPDTEAVEHAVELERLLHFEGTSRLSPLFDDARTSVDRFVHWMKTGSTDSTSTSFRKNEQGKEELLWLKKWCHHVSDMFWDWHRSSPACFRACPDHKKLRNLTFIEGRLESIPTRCNDPRQCSGQFSRSFLEWIADNVERIRPKQLSN